MVKENKMADREQIKVAQKFLSNPQLSSEQVDKLLLNGDFANLVDLTVKQQQYNNNYPKHENQFLDG